jgi:glycosyltransferase involved in cell wall biosynthesis
MSVSALLHKPIPARTEREREARRRVALLTNIPAPYRLEMFRQLHQRHELKVFFDSASEPNRAWNLPADMGFPHEYLQSRLFAYQRQRPDAVPGEQRFRQISWQLIPALRRFQPDVVISAELGVRTLQGSAYCTLSKTPLMIWWEGTPHTEGWVRKHQSALRRCLLRRATRFWSNGTESSKLLRSYGAAAEQIDECMIGTDTERFASETQGSLNARERVRQALGLSGAVFLFVGRFVKPKGLVPFLAALERLQSTTEAEFSVLCIGGGPDRSLLENWKSSHPSSSLVTLDFQQPSALPAFYAAADVFVLPTLEDNWSLVALEAAAAGLPQIFSVYNGAAPDLIARQAEGVSVDPTSTNDFAAALKAFAEHPPARMSESRRAQITQFYSAQSCADRASRSIELCCSQHSSVAA